MTFQVDNDALKAAMLRHYETKLSREMREMFIFTQNPDMAEIWKLYMEEVTRKEKQKKDQAMDGGDMFMIVILVALIIYAVSRLFTASPT